MSTIERNLRFAAGAVGRTAHRAVCEAVREALRRPVCRGAIAALGLLLSWAGGAWAGTPLIIDDFAYASTAQARAAWPAMGSSPPVTMANAGEWGAERVMRLPCNFSVEPSRCYWDRSVNLDLADYDQFALEVFVADSSAVSIFTLYFRSGSGWYGGVVDVKARGWQTLIFDKKDFTPEGTPSGWATVDRIRLSPWRESPRDTYLAVRELRAFSPYILIVRDTASGDPETVSRTISLLSKWLSSWNVFPGVIDSVGWNPAALADSRMVVLPYNEVVSDALLDSLEMFVANGGKLMVHFLLNDRLEDLLAMDWDGLVSGDFGAFTFNDGTIPRLPPRVSQDSWRFTRAAPRSELNSRVIATWEDGAGIPTGQAAWLASDNGLFFSDVLLPGDPPHKREMLLALIGHYVPEVWPTAARAAFEDIGRVAEYLGYSAASADIRAKGAATPRAAEVDAKLAAADVARERAAAQRAAGQHADAVASALEARSHLLEAYFLCQSSSLPEFRAVSEHNALGPYPGDWPRAIDALVAGGFDAVFPNLLLGGLAHYDSALLPHSEQFDTFGDQARACIDAAHARGVEVHAWKVNYNLVAAPQSFIDSMRAADRTQVTSAGAPLDWLCPSHPDNFALERDSMLEVVRNYDVDGIQFDYIRYPGPDSCYCQGCRQRFQADTGHAVTNWPADVLAGGPLESEYLDWRREQVTRLVAAVHHAVKVEKPQVEISAAVYARYADAYNDVGQDWVAWIDRGIVDVLCPMDYTADHDAFRELVSDQMARTAGRVPIYPLIGPSSVPPDLGPDGVIVQIAATRAARTGGFLVFELSDALIGDTLPGLAAATTLPGRVSETPDGHRVPGRPLTLERAPGGELTLQWGPACDERPGLTDYTVYRGSLAALRTGRYDHVPAADSSGGNTSIALATAQEAAYFVVVPNDTSREGGYGFDSAGQPRPASAEPHLPASRTDCP